MEREACVCDHGYERSDLCAEIIIYTLRIMTCINYSQDSMQGIAAKMYI